MTTVIRRFILRFAVGLLTFLIGVGAGWALGGLNPFQSSEGTRYYRHKRCGSHRSWSPPPSAEGFEGASINDPVFLKGPRGCRVKKFYGEMMPPPPPAPVY